MIEEIGITIGLCAITWGAYVANRWSLHKWLAAVTALVSIMVVAHLGFSLISRQFADGADPALVASTRTTGAKLQVHRTPAGEFTLQSTYLGARKIANTSLKREWVVIQNPDLPLQIDPKTTGIKPVYDDGLKWKASYDVTAS